MKQTLSQSYGHQGDSRLVVALYNLWRGIFSDQSNVLQQDQQGMADLSALKLHVSKDENVFFLIRIMTLGRHSKNFFLLASVTKILLDVSVRSILFAVISYEIFDHARTVVYDRFLRNRCLPLLNQSEPILGVAIQITENCGKYIENVKFLRNGCFESLYSGTEKTMTMLFVPSTNECIILRL